MASMASVHRLRQLGPSFDMVVSVRVDTVVFRQLAHSLHMGCRSVTEPSRILIDGFLSDTWHTVVGSLESRRVEDMPS